MRIKIGDHVRFLNDVGEGVVRKLIDNQMVEVETSDGWTIPYLISELIVIPTQSDQEPFRPEAPPVVFHEPKKSAPTPNMTDAPAVFLLAVRDNDSNGSLKSLRWYLVNDSTFTLDFTFYNQENKEVNMVEKEQLEAGTKIFLEEIKSENLTSIKGFHIQGLLSQEGNKLLPPLVSAFIPLSVKKFNSDGAYQENDYLHEPAIVFNVIQQSPSSTQLTDSDQEDSKKSLNQTSQRRTSKKDKPGREVDLHINELVESVVGMSNREILKVQLLVFERELNKAITDREKEIVFIHGIGNGTLKENLRKTIKADYPVCSIEDASFKNYGFGATLVIIRQNR